MKRCAEARALGRGFAHGTLAVSTSVGVAFYGGIDEIEADAIIKQADRALYEAKAAGRDTYRVAEERAA